MRTCITVCCTAVARVETGIVVPGIDWFAPVAALYTEAQQAGATWNRAAVSLNPRLGDGLEVHASYLGMADGPDHP